MPADMPQSQVRCPCGATLAFSHRPGRTAISCPRCRRKVPLPLGPAAGAAAGIPPLASLPEARWFVARGNKQKFGPFSSAQLKQLAATGQVLPGDMVLREGQGKWAAASSISGLFGGSSGGRAAGVAPPVPAAAVHTDELEILPEPGAPAAAVYTDDVEILPEPGPESTRGRAGLASWCRAHWPWVAAAAGGAVVVLVVAILFLAGALGPRAGESTPTPPQVASKEEGKGKPGEPPGKANPPPQEGGGTGPSWKEFVSPEGRFAARFPGEPKTASHKTKDGLTGEAVAELPGGARYEARYTDFDKAASGASKFLLDATVKQFGPTATAPKEVKVDGHAGVELRVEKGDVVMAMRLFMVKERLYHLLAAAPRASFDAARAAQFLDSFKLLPGQPEPPPEGPKTGEKPGWERVLQLPNRFAFSKSLAFSPDGKILAAGNSDGEVQLWDVASGKLRVALPGHRPAKAAVGAEVRQVAFSPNGKLLASAGWDKTVRLWDPESHRELATLPQDGFANGVAFTPDGKTLAVAVSDQTVALWDVDSRQRRKVLRGHKGDVMAVAIAPDGGTLASGSEDDTVILWDLAKGTERAVLRGHGDGVWVVTFTRDSKFLASGSQDQTARIWDVARGQEIKTLRGHKGFISAVAFAPGGKTLVTASMDKTVKLWDVAAGKEFMNYQASKEVDSVAVSPDGKTLAVGILDDTIRLWSVEATVPGGLELDPKGGAQK
jgi:hypothetical protein